MSRFLTTAPKGEIRWLQARSSSGSTSGCRTTPTRLRSATRTAGQWKDITWRDYGDLVNEVGQEPHVAGLRTWRQDRAPVRATVPSGTSSTLPRCRSVGRPQPIYSTNSPEQVAYIVDHSESKVAFVDTTEQLEKILKIRSDVPKLQKVVVFEGYQGDADKDFVMTWDDFLALGGSVAEDQLRRGGREGQARGPRDLRLHLRNHRSAEGRDAHAREHLVDGARTPSSTSRSAEAEDARALSYLPLSHIAERMISHLLQIYYGTQTWFAESIDTLLVDLNACKPTYFFGVPRVWEKFYAGCPGEDGGRRRTSPKSARRSWRRRRSSSASQVTKAEQEAVGRGGKMADAKVPLGMKLQHAALDKLVLSKIRERFGLDECELALVRRGAAELRTSSGSSTRSGSRSPRATASPRTTVRPPGTRRTRSRSAPSVPRFPDSRSRSPKTARSSFAAATS